MLQLYLPSLPRCNQCGREFFRSASLRYHLKAHATGRGTPVECDVCGRSFTTQHRLNRHKEFKHPVQAKVYMCNQCGKYFTAASKLLWEMTNFEAKGLCLRPVWKINSSLHMRVGVGYTQGTEYTHMSRPKFQEEDFFTAGKRSCRLHRIQIKVCMKDSLLSK